jgi:dTDP-4-amino-4,6-dideoxygalactose transaminase
MKIPFNKPYITQGSYDAIKQALDSSKLGGDGTICKAVEQHIEDLFHVSHCLLTTSGTHALEMAMMLLHLQPGEEVITPSFTFVSTANAILRAGGKPVFCEINDRTLTVDVNDVDKRITPRTRAIVPVHYAGVSAEMDELCTIAERYNLQIIEDAAQGVNAQYKGKYLGTIGNMGAYSFHETKNYVSGEGGAFLTNNEQFARQAEIIREKGTNRSNFLRGEIDKYTWVDLGSSYVLSEILAALLKSQLEEVEKIQHGRKRIHVLYEEGLKECEKKEKLRLPIIPDYCVSNYHVFYVLLPDNQKRNTLMKKLKESGISATFHYIPLHSSPYALNKLGLRNFQLPVSERIAETLLRLPLYPQLTDDEVQYIIEKVKSHLE